MRARPDSVNSRKLATEPVRPTGGLSESTAGGGSESSLLRGEAHFGFPVKKFFLVPLKIKFIFFLSVLAAISSLKPAGGEGRERM
jgi:hypothetical protein